MEALCQSKDDFSLMKSFKVLNGLMLALKIALEEYHNTLSFADTVELR